MLLYPLDLYIIYDCVSHVLQRSYHPTVRKFGCSILGGREGKLSADLEKMYVTIIRRVLETYVPNMNFNSLLSICRNCTNLYKQYDPSKVVFKPSIRPPTKGKTNVIKFRPLNDAFISDCNDKFERVPNVVNFSPLLNIK